MYATAPAVVSCHCVGVSWGIEMIWHLLEMPSQARELDTETSYGAKQLSWVVLLSGEHAGL